MTIVESKKKNIKETSNRRQWQQ